MSSARMIFSRRELGPDCKRAGLAGFACREWRMASTFGVDCFPRVAIGPISNVICNESESQWSTGARNGPLEDMSLLSLKAQPRISLTFPAGPARRVHSGRGCVPNRRERGVHEAPVLGQGRDDSAVVVVERQRHRIEVRLLAGGSPCLGDCNDAVLIEQRHEGIADSSCSSSCAVGNSSVPLSNCTVMPMRWLG